MIEALAIVDRPPQAGAAPPGLAFLPHEGIAGVYRAVTTHPAPTAADDLWEHEHLIEDLMAERAVLPLRYGTVLEDERQLGQVLVQRGEEFQRLLDHVRGRVELALRVVIDDDEAPATTASGGEYMRALARRRRRGQKAASLLEPLEAIANASVARDAGGEAWTRRAYLVDRERVGEFNRQLEVLRGSHPELQVTCTGPWPPYSFTSGGPS